jgi:hypothetical protein
LPLAQFNEFLPVSWIDYGAIVVVALIAIGLLLKFRRWFSIIPSGLFTDAKKYLGRSAIAISFFSVLGHQVIGQRDVITDSKSRWMTHFLVVWGFIALSIATIWDDLFFRNGTLPPPFSLANFGNIIGNVGGVMVLAGTTVILLRYFVTSKFKEAPKGDMFFFFFLYLAVVSGFATELARSLGFILPTFAIFALHVGLVGALFISAPFTHFFHAVQVPFLRFVDRVHSSLMTKAGSSLLNRRAPFRSDYRRLVMTDQATGIGLDNAKSTFPSWLDKEEKNRNRSSDSEE